MGFFGSIAKLAGKVVKGIASKATHGASDLLLKQLKGTGQAKQAAKAVATRQITQQQQAAAAGVAPLASAVKAKSPKKAKRKKAYKRTYKAPAEYGGGMWNPQTFDESYPGVRKAKKAPKKAAKKAKRASTGGKRTPPKGGLDLKAIASAWRAAGKPGKWIDYIKSNPIRKK